MERIRIEGEKMTVSFNKEIYPERSIDEAISYLQGKLKLTRKDNVVVIESGNEKVERETGYEFYNLVHSCVKNA